MPDLSLISLWLWLIINYTYLIKSVMQPFTCCIWSWNLKDFTIKNNYSILVFMRIILFYEKNIIFLIIVIIKISSWFIEIVYRTFCHICVIKFLVIYLLEWIILVLLSYVNLFLIRSCFNYNWWQSHIRA